MLADLRAMLRPGAKILDAWLRHRRTGAQDARAPSSGFSHGLTTELALQKCCTVGAPVLPGAAS